MPENAKPDLEAAYNLGSPDANRGLYRDWATTYDSEFAQRSGYRLPRLVAAAYLGAGGGWPALDAGCGTGLVAEYLPEDAVIDGLDISAEMLARAAAKGRYRTLHEVDLTEKLPLSGGEHAGLLSSGTFTHGHVGPEALHELLRVLRSGAICAIAANKAFYQTAGFRQVLDGLVATGAITPPEITEDRIYSADANAPEGHADDTGLILTFRKT